MADTESNELHAYLVKCMVHTMTDAGIDPLLASNIAAQVDEDIRQQYGCDRHYIPAPSKRQRNDRIIRLWRQGVSRQDIANQVGVGTTTVNNVINASLNGQNHGFGRDGWNL